MLAHPAGDVEHPHLAGVVDHLEQVPVTGHDVDRHRRGRGQGADHVVGLVPVVTDERPAQGPQHVDDHRHLDGEIIGRLLTGRDAEDAISSTALSPAPATRCAL